jgi:4-amino-4-deoxy-L-arabinose transferase-like glycosyltransferase
MLPNIPLNKVAAIALPLLIGLALRLTGIRHGEPEMVYHPDVAKQTLVARHVYHGDLNIRKLFHDDFRRVLYPYGASVILGNLARLGGSHMDEVHRWRWALRMRWLSVTLIMVSSLALLAVLSRHLRPLPLLLAGLALLAEPMNAQFSHYGMNDVPLLSFMFLTLACSMLMAGEKNVPSWSLLCGLWAGMGFAVKYQGVLALVFPGMVWLTLLKQRPMRQTCFSALAVAAGFFAGVLALCPVLRKEPAYFFGRYGDFMRWQADIMGTGTPLSEKLVTNLYAFGHLFFARGFALLIPLALLGALLVWRRRKDHEMLAPVLSCLLLGCLLLAAILCSRDMVRQNDMIPVMAFLIIPAVAAPDHMKGMTRQAALTLVGALGVMFLWVSSLDALALRREDTRLLARNWCDTNLPAGVTVAYERYTLPPTRHDLTTLRCKFLGDASSRHLIAKGRATVCIASALAYERFFDRGSPYFDESTQRAYRMLRSDYELLKEFEDRQLVYAQPKISIYQRKSHDP